MSRITNLFFLAAIAALSFLTSCDKKSNNQPLENDTISNAVILKWNDIAFQTVGGPANTHSLMNSRVYAMVHAAMFDAVNATNPSFSAFAYSGNDKGADPTVAAAVAAHHVLKTTFANRADYLDSALNVFLAEIPNSPAKTKALGSGVAAADALLALGFNDNGASDPIGQPVPATEPGDYKNVPPFNFIFAPFWQDSKLFALQSNDQFRCPAPPAIQSDTYTADFNEVKNVGKNQSAVRTPEQSAYAKYWYEFSEVGWNRIAAIVATQKKTGLFQTARLFALLNFAMADAYTAGWESKLHYNFWRPFTAIRDAATDNNPATEADLTWEPAEPTPPIQDYPSTHSALGNAAASVLAFVYGNQTAFTMGSPTAIPAGSPRSFNSFSQAADENADSRVMAGIHFRFACKAGQQLGSKIGDWTVSHKLTPLQ